MASRNRNPCRRFKQAHSQHEFPLFRIINTIRIAIKLFACADEAGNGKCKASGKNASSAPKKPWAKSIKIYKKFCCTQPQLMWICFMTGSCPDLHTICVVPHARLYLPFGVTTHARRWKTICDATFAGVTLLATQRSPLRSYQCPIHSAAPNTRLTGYSYDHKAVITNFKSAGSRLLDRDRANCTK